MVRRRRALLAPVLAAGLGLAAAACREHTVSVAYAPEVGDRYEYRYEISARVTRTLEGEAPQHLDVDTVLLAEQRVEALTDDGARVELELTRDGGLPRTAVVLLDRAGSLEGVELVDDLDPDVFGVAGTDALVATHLDGPPDRPLAPGERWTLSDGPRHGTGTLERLGVIDGEDVAVVRTEATEDLSRSVRAGGTTSRVAGTLRSGARTAYDLDDGALRRSRSWSHGRLRALLAPPPGVDADPVPAAITYDVEVEVTRLR